MQYEIEVIHIIKKGDYMQENEFLDRKIKDCQFAINSSQIILVVKDKLYFYQKINKKWQRLIVAHCIYGENGYSQDRHEGDKTTPIGEFRLLYAFGTEDNPGTKMKYRKILDTSYFSNDCNNLQQYNRWAESDKPIKGEHLIEYPKEYHYGVVIGFNIEPVTLGMGSGIFLHCKGNKNYTAGCIAVDDNVMLNLLKLLEPGGYIVLCNE